MVKVAGVLVCLLIVGMDVGAGILGIQAEAAQNKVKHLRLWIFECRDPSHDAFKLALGAAALLTLSHVLGNLLGGCMCVCSQEEFQSSSTNRIILAVGLSALVIGILSNNKSKGSCGLTHHHFLSIGGILCFVHGLFSVAYYVSATAASDEGK
ncbi:protein VASCULATURE COMPLEXITY AND CONNECTIVITY isoform X2 [Gossypium raimondii]|uniref:protein VASCULATURE COMPLEXITY AND CONNECTIVITY isoform X2 n=1 Tax=Gossypium raimondii TaxID=29730 RepID=UPI00227A5D9D|nr:protein VASCULATURE COMPLEXITY AND CONNECTIVITY isoform X2 [Gossypium raimondii]